MPTYTKTTWVNDQAPAINDTNLNNIESGIDNLYNEFDANTILKADVDNTPIKLAVAASRILGRKSTGGIDALTAAEAKALLAIAIADISDIPGTCASILTDHNKATHDALGIAPAEHGYDKHTDRTRRIFVPVAPAGGATEGNYAYYHAVYIAAEAAKAVANIRVPSDYVSNGRILVVCSDMFTDEAATIDFYLGAASHGESRTTHVISNTTFVQAFTATYLYEYEIFTTADLSFLVAADIIGLYAQTDNYPMYILGFVFEYTADM
jgi:hypothetical protein